jgi:hypothetical protein
MDVFDEPVRPRHAGRTRAPGMIGARPAALAQ